MPRFTQTRDAVRLIAIFSAISFATAATAAEDLEFYDSSAAPVPGFLMTTPDTDLTVPTSTVRSMLRQLSRDEAARIQASEHAQNRAADNLVEDYQAAGENSDQASEATGEFVTADPAIATPAPMTAAGVVQTPDPRQIATMPTQDATPMSGVDLPRILSASDAKLYREIFDLQDRKRWRSADKLIKKLSSPLLLGHVRFQRLMHRNYRAKYKELRDWMVRYRDHPGAEQVYKLARKRRPKNYRSPPRPVREKTVQQQRPRRDRYDGRTSYHRLSSWKRRYVRTTQRRIRNHLYRGRTTRALKLLNRSKTRRVFDAVSLDESRAQVAGGLFQIGKTKKALELAAPAGDRSGPVVPMAHWWAGLAAWRLGNAELAARHFGAMSDGKLRSKWTRSATAFWAARAYLVSSQPDRVNYYLKKAARYPRTFYGLLAIRSLGTEPSYDWSLPAPTGNAWQALQEKPHVKRAVALLQVDEVGRAEKELKRIGGAISPEMARVLVSVSVRHNLPSLSLRVGDVLHHRDNETYDSALYPLPEWEPSNGFTIDRALLYAVMRQESRFRIRAKSRAGARGLMQLMPRTASYMAGKRFRGSRRGQLFDPELNMTLGQKYVHHLLEDPNIDGDLFYTVAAYNGGPGNLRKWRRRNDYLGDPLLFIESIPLSETRDYVERVLTNLWIYRYRLGQPSPSLDAIASGEWPSYTSLDSKPSSYASKTATGL